VSSLPLVRAQPGELQVYKGAAWTQPMPDLVLDTLLRAFADSGRVPGLARRGEGIDADYELLLDLRRFEADYTDGDAPVTRIELGARLVHNTENRVVDARVFAANIRAEGDQAADLQRATERGLGEIFPQLIGWTLAKRHRGQVQQMNLTPSHRLFGSSGFTHQ
jgi:cholesterol transport system auxiliary component